MSFSRKLVETIANASFVDASATVIGCGYMGREYIKALQVLNVPSIQVCSKSEPKFEVLSTHSRISAFSSGYLKFDRKAKPEALAIIATPTKDLIPAAKHLQQLGFRRFLIEKPVALSAKEIKVFESSFVKEGMEVRCAFNRVTYPSFLEAKHLIEQEGGATSCCYTLTEIIGKDWIQRFPEEELARWGIANSLHVVSMAHGLIGLPKEWKGFQEGQEIPWHPNGSIFVGSGISERGTPFVYHADWTSTGRWSVEVHTKKASYLFCPLEKLLRRVSFKEPWVEVPIYTFDKRIKIGIVEEVAAMLKPTLRESVSLYSLQDVVKLTEFGERIFGYAA